MNQEFCRQQCGEDYKKDNPEECYKKETCNIRLGCGSPWYIPDEHDAWNRFIDEQMDVLEFIYDDDSRYDDWLWYPVLSAQDETKNPVNGLSGLN